MKNKTVVIVRFSLLVSAVLLIAAGLLKREHIEVMGKAVKICLECIGIA